MGFRGVLKVLSFIGWTVLLLGLILLGARYWELQSWSRTEGVVVKYRKGVHGKPPYVAYKVDGREFVIGSKVRRRRLAKTDLKRGDKVGVYYPPDDPGAGRLDLFLDLWLVPTILTANGAFLVVISQIISRARSMIFNLRTSDFLA